MNLLMIAFEDGRWGASRLAKPLQAAGFRVAALCPSSNPLAKTRFVGRHFPLDNVKSERRLEARLGKAMQDWQPRLIVPADEQAVAWLHALVREARQGRSGKLSTAMLATIEASLGHADQFDAMLMKTDTLRLAQRLGIRVSRGVTIGSAEAVMAAAEQIGFPLFVKTSFSWGGQGVQYCRDQSAAATVFAGMRHRARGGGVLW